MATSYAPNPEATYQPGDVVMHVPSGKPVIVIGYPYYSPYGGMTAEETRAKDLASGDIVYVAALLAPPCGAPGRSFEPYEASEVFRAHARWVAQSIASARGTFDEAVRVRASFEGKKVTA